MKTLRYFTYITLSILVFTACTKDPKPDIDVIPETCVGQEIITDTTSTYFKFEKGSYNWGGFAQGIKLNLPFEASAFIDKRKVTDSTVDIELITYWPRDVFAEHIYINDIPIDPESNCLNLTNNPHSTDSIFISYNFNQFDIRLLDFKLDLNEENKLEFISYDKETNRFKAKLKASFISDYDYLPDLPGKVRFSDVYVEYGY